MISVGRGFRCFGAVVFWCRTTFDVGRCDTHVLDNLPLSFPFRYIISCQTFSFRIFLIPFVASTLLFFKRITTCPRYHNQAYTNTRNVLSNVSSIHPTLLPAHPTIFLFSFVSLVMASCSRTSRTQDRTGKIFLTNFHHGWLSRTFLSSSRLLITLVHVLFIHIAAPSLF